MVWTLQRERIEGDEEAGVLSVDGETQTTIDTGRDGPGRGRGIGSNIDGEGLGPSPETEDSHIAETGGVGKRASDGAIGTMKMNPSDLRTGSDDGIGIEAGARAGRLTTVREHTAGQCIETWLRRITPLLFATRTPTCWVFGYSIGARMM